MIATTTTLTPHSTPQPTLTTQQWGRIQGPFTSHPQSQTHQPFPPHRPFLPPHPYIPTPYMPTPNPPISPPNFATPLPHNTRTTINTHTATQTPRDPFSPSFTQNGSIKCRSQSHHYDCCPPKNTHTTFRPPQKHHLPPNHNIQHHHHPPRRTPPHKNDYNNINTYTGCRESHSSAPSGTTGRSSSTQRLDLQRINSKHDSIKPPS